MKYVRVDVHFKEGMVRREVFVFPDDFTHALIAEELKVTCRRHWPGCVPNVVSAGSVNLGEVETHGKSESLDLVAQEEDGALLMVSDYAGHVIYG